VIITSALHIAHVLMIIYKYVSIFHGNNVTAPDSDFNIWVATLRVLISPLGFTWFRFWFCVLLFAWCNPFWASYDRTKRRKENV